MHPNSLLRLKLSPSQQSVPDRMEIVFFIQRVINVDVGSILTVTATFADAAQEISARILNLHIVGIFKLPGTDDSFWHGNDFHFYQPNDFVTIFRGLTSNAPLISIFDRLDSDPALQGSVFQLPMSVIWYYHIDPSHLSVDNLNSLITGISNVKVDNANYTDLETSPFLSQTVTYLPTPTLQQYSERIPIAQLPVTALTWLMFGLVLFFVSMMADLLVDRQIEAIAVMRSRGASSLQIFGALVFQGIGLAIVAIVLGPLLSISIARFLVHQTLSTADQGALNVIAGDPIHIVSGVRDVALIAVGAAVLTMILALLRSLGIDVLAARRQSARSTHRPLWLRWNLDIIAAVIALTGFALSLYITSAGILDAHSALLLLSPLTVLGAVSLLIAGMLLLLRLFPLLLQACAGISVRGRGASTLLALAQMARAPRQSMRMTMLLGIATTFAIFSFVCTASQSQRVLDVTAYEAGADISGTIPVKLVTQAQLADATAAYLKIPNITSASLGYVKLATAGNNLQGMSIDFHAIDTDTFGNTAIWTTQDSSQSLISLMQQLSNQRNSAIAHQLIPAVVDTETWNTLHLSAGRKFTLNFSLNDYADLLNFVAVAEVQHIPTQNTGSIPAIMVDYRTFATVYKKKFAQNSDFAVPVNTVWLKTSNDPVALNGILHAISSGDLRLDSIFDRRAMITSLYREPLYLTLTGVLTLGAITALLLALGGNLIASWLYIRSRLASFTILRALGATSGQITATLLWEQSIIYVTSIFLGIIFGVIFSAMTVPVLVFTSITPAGVTSSISNGTFYVAQTVPPIQIIVPQTLSITLIVLVISCIVTVSMMIRIISRSSISQILRLNED